MILASVRLVHLAVHTFCPGRRGRSRHADFAILYDPRRPLERAFATRLRAAVLHACPELRVRRNHPFLGRSDGLATAMRRRLGSRRYLGIELELSQPNLSLGALLTMERACLAEQRLVRIFTRRDREQASARRDSGRAHLKLNG